MQNLEELLRMPRYGKWAHNWKDLTNGNTLFQKLSYAINNNSLGEAQDLIDGWEKFVQHCEKDPNYVSNKELKAKIRDQWSIARRMVWCAGQAATQPDFYFTEVDRVCFALKDLPEYIKEDEAWAWICIRTFLNMPARQVKVPVAAWEEQQGKEEGLLATLILEKIEKGAGEIAHHPIDVFCSDIDEEFRSAIEDALIAAKNLVRQEGREVLYDCRWRLLKDDKHPISKATGGSAGGAAALGWYHLLRGTIPDEKIIVLGQVDQEGGLHGVDGVGAKVSAISADRHFDTIVMANEENLHQAKTSAKKLINKGQIYIEHCIPSRIDHLVTIRSQLVNDLLSYLKTMEEDLTRNPLLNLFDRKLDDLRIPLQVVPYEPARNVDEISTSKDFRETLEREGKDRDNFEKNIYQSRGTQHDDRETPYLRKRLNELASRLERLVLLGDPGSGKTEWLKHQVCLALRETQKRIEGFEAKLKDICLPVYIRLIDVSEALHMKSRLEDFLVNNGCIQHGSFSSLSKAEEASAAILMSMNINYKMTERLIQWVWEKKLWSQKGTGTPLLVCLDAWDEVRKGQEDLANCLKEFAQQQKARIFLTSRILGYSHNHPPLPIDNKNDGSYSVLEICPFQWDETETFVKLFFHNDPDIGNKMLGELRTKIPIAGMIQNPLLATLLCRLFSSPASGNDPCLHLPVKRCEVYQRILEELLGEWRGEINTCRPPDAEPIENKIILLGEIAYHFFPNEAIKRESLHDFLRWGKEDSYMNGLSNINQIKQMIKEICGTRPIKEFLEDGILVPCGGMSIPDYYMFLHLTFQEYLAASILARKADNEGWESIKRIVDKKAWDPVWQEVIILLAGKLKDPISLLELLSKKKKDDYFRHRLALGALCLPEINSAKPDIQKEMDHITTEYFCLWVEHRNNGTEYVIPYLTRGLPALGQANARICATCFGTLSTHLVFGQALYNLISEREEGLPLLDCLSELLRYKLLHYNDRDIQKTIAILVIAASAVGGLGSAATRPDILDGIAEMLRGKGWGIQEAAAEALRGLRSAAAQPYYIPKPYYIQKGIVEINLKG